MGQEFVNKIEKIIIAAREFAESAQPYEIPENIIDMEPRDVWILYAKAVNYRDKVYYHLKSINFCISLVSDAVSKIDANTPQGTTRARQMNTVLTSLKNIKVPIQNINDSMYDTLTFYEKLGVRI